jgi:hypothetical protein
MRLLLDKRPASPLPSLRVERGGEGSGVGGCAWGNGAAAPTTPHPSPSHHSLREWWEGVHRICGAGSTYRRAA